MMKSLHVLLVGIWFMSAGLAGAESPWHEFAVRPFFSWIANAGSVDSGDGYSGSSLGADGGPGICLSVLAGHDVEVALSLETSGASGTQNTDGLPPRRVSVDATRLMLTGKMRPHNEGAPIVPWAGGGLNVVFVDTSARPEQQRSSSASDTSPGLHLTAGLDLYPVYFSGVALSLEMLYMYQPFDSRVLSGDMNGLVFRVGLRWDVWMRGTR